MAIYNESITETITLDASHVFSWGPWRGVGGTVTYIWKDVFKNV